MNTKETLSYLGLEGKKADIYRASLELGEGRASDIAHKAGVNRTTAYVILKELIKQGLMAKTSRRGITLFIAERPTTLKTKLLEKLAQVEKIIPELDSFYNASPKKPAIRFYDGLEGIKTIYEDTLKQPAGSEILGYITADVVRYLPDYTNRYIERRLEKRIKVKAIYASDDLPLLKKHLARSREELREAIILPRKEFDFTDEINIYQDKVAIASYQGDKFGLIIQSRSIAQTQRLIFKLSWTAAKLHEQNKLNLTG